MFLMATQEWKDSHQEQMKEYRRNHYKKNRDYYIQRTLERKRTISEYLQDYKMSHPCVYCGESDPCCIDFHHMESDKKEINLAMASTKGWGMKRVNREIEKCITVCANCHRKIHSGKLN